MWDRQPRWPRKTPIAPSRRGPGGGRWRDDGKPNKPGHTWAEVASSVIGHVIGHHGGESAHSLADDVRYAFRGGHREGHGTGHPTTGHEGGGPHLTHQDQMSMSYPSAMRAMGATDADLTYSPEHAPYVGNDPQQLAIRRRHGLPDDASPHEIGQAIRYHSTGGRVGSPGRSTHTLAQHGHPLQPTAHGQAIAAALHEDWRSGRLVGGTHGQADAAYEPRMKTTTDQKWIAAHGTDQVDIANTSYADLPADWQKENGDAGEVVASILARHGGSVDLTDQATRAQIGHEIHTEWLGRENNSYARGGALDVPFSQLPADEQEKDIAQVRVGMSVPHPAAAEQRGVAPRAGTFIGNVPDTHGNARPQPEGASWADRVDQFISERDTHSGRAAEDAIGEDVYNRLTAPDNGQVDSRLLGHLTNTELTGARDSISAKASHPDTSDQPDESVLDRVDQELSRRGAAHPAILQATQHVAALTAHLRATRRSGDPLARRAMDHLTAAGHDRAALYEMQRVLRRRGEEHTDAALTPSMGRAVSRAIAATSGRSA